MRKTAAEYFAMWNTEKELFLDMFQRALNEAYQDGRDSVNREGLTVNVHWDEVMSKVKEEIDNAFIRGRKAEKLLNKNDFYQIVTTPPAQDNKKSESKCLRDENDNRTGMECYLKANELVEVYLLKLEPRFSKTTLFERNIFKLDKRILFYLNEILK